MERFFIFYPNNRLSRRNPLKTLVSSFSKGQVCVLVTFASSSSHSPDKVQGKRYTGQEFEGKQSFPDSSEPVLGEVPRGGGLGRKRERIGCSRMCSKLKRRPRKRKSSWNSRKGGRVVRMWYSRPPLTSRHKHRTFTTAESRNERKAWTSTDGREVCARNDIGVQRGEKNCDGGGGIEKKTRSGTSTLCPVRLQVIELSRPDRELRRPINRRMETRCGSGDQISNRGRRTIVSRLNKYSIGYNLWTFGKSFEMLY